MFFDGYESIEGGSIHASSIDLKVEFFSFDHAIDIFFWFDIIEDI